ncbi:hypothetical protein CfE428DRAFT_1595 [Chthoniobacter flavus Ellin428]|uniref:Uncharacterized protein n=1 Tax=Chthoniobacter flavus Ellin428 TaxID=497964 RepID=B4CWY2_9BACT|nr:hypothetical protein CfE428DRAFT_1595 [Chthoniobacter flavus Ellin428]TCO84929.1 hypothetical protein EV701_13349 [Chthoniobacter flavus]
MNALSLVSFILIPAVLVVGCANEPSMPKKDDRLGVSSGVTLSSHDMSRVSPARPNTMPPN